MWNTCRCTLLLGLFVFLMCLKVYVLVCNLRFSGILNSMANACLQAYADHTSTAGNIPPCETAPKKRRHVFYQGTDNY
jgi:hypothetical protein